MASPPFHALLAGGGTGGHIFPALSLAEELRARGWVVSFAGSAKGLEARLVPARGIELFTLPVKPLVGQGLLGKVRSLTTLAVSAWAARKLIRKIGADVVVGTGGYVSAPAVLGARLARRPVLLLEPNAHTGVANRQLSRFATEAAVAFEETAREFHCPARVTGTPIRKEFFEVPDLTPPWAPPRILVLGGSQGAQQLNEAVPLAIGELGERHPGLVVLHQCGKKNLASTRETYDRLRAAGRLEGEVEVVPFLEDVAGAMAKSHLVISRAGALTLAEICAAGRPSLLVPLAHALGHQGDNARILEGAEAASVIGDFPGEPSLPPKEFAHFLAGELTTLLGDPKRLEKMGRAARKLAGNNASKTLADRLEVWAREGRS